MTRRAHIGLLLLFLILPLGFIQWKPLIHFHYLGEGAEGPSPLVIGLIQVGNEPVAEMDALCTYLQKEFGAEVVEMRPMALPGKGLKKHGHNAREILQILELVKPRHLTHIIGFTTTQLYQNGQDPRVKLGVHGLGQKPGSAVIVTNYHIHRTEELPNERINRMYKTVVHELGHNLGLNHCDSSPICIMRNDMASESRFYKDELHLCDQCRSSFVGHFSPLPPRTETQALWWTPIPRK